MTRQRIANLGGLIAALALGLAASEALAITEVYTNKARFLSLTGGKQISEPYPADLQNVPEFVSGPLTLSTPGSETLTFLPWTNAFPGADLAIAGSENLNVEVSFATSSIGFDFIGATSFSIRLLRDGETVYSGDVTTNASTRFVGLWSDTPFTQVEIRDTTSAQDEYWGAFYSGSFKNRDRDSNTGALVCQLPLLAAHNFALGASFTAPTPLDLGFGFGAYSANLALKFCPAWAIAPPDIITHADNPNHPDPNSDAACFKTYKQERIHSQFTNVLGVPVDYDYDWGDLGTPSVVHQNSDVEVYQLIGRIPPRVDDLSLAALLGDEFATDGIYSDCDDIKEVSNDGYTCPYAKDRELKFRVGRGGLTYRFDTNMGLLDFVYIAVPKFPHGTKNKATKDFALDLLTEVAQIVWDVALGGWRFGNFVDRQQAVVVYDLHAPTINKATGDFNDDGVTNQADQLFIDNVEIEADEIGGVSASRFQGFLRSMFETDDACGRAVTFFADYPSDELRVFWPVCTNCNDGNPSNDDSFELTWIARDRGPNLDGLPNETTRTQTIKIVDTRPPVMQPPMDIVEVTSQTAVTLDLGQPLVFDLVDLNPTITNDAVFPLSPGLHTITWTATDASGNSESVTQSVNIKNSNIEPEADALAGNDRQNAVSFEPTELRLTGFDADNDPLNFFIEDFPENGFFVAPLYPFFIEDYRLEATIDDDNVQAEICDGRPSGSDFVHMPVIRNPFYFSVLDDGTTYVMDNGYVWCRESTGQQPSFSERIAVFDATGAFVTGLDVNGIPDDLYIDTRTNQLYLTQGTLSNGRVSVLDADLNTIQGYNLFSMRDANNVSHNIPFATSAVLDGRGVMYVLTERGDVHAVRAEIDPGNTNLRPEYLGIVLQTGNQGTNFDMAIDTVDNLYVSMGNRVYKIGPATAENGDIELGSLTGWLGKCEADLAPGDQAVCDVTNQRSLGYSCTDEYCPGNKRGDQPGQFDDSRGIAIDKNNNLYVTDYQNFRVQRFTPEGFFAGQAESACEGNCFVLGDFGRPRDIAVNSTHFFILDPDTDLLHISKTSPFIDVGDDYATLLYSSNNDFACVDSADCIDTFTFSVSDGVRDSDTMQMKRSAPALVQIEVERNFRPPFATPGITVTTPEELPAIITLDGSDPDPLDALSFTITRQPEFGSLNVIGDQATYVSALNYVGNDSFAFTVSDGNETSAPEDISIEVTDVNDPAMVIFEDSPIVVARGFEVQLEGTIDDPDPVDQHALVVNWNDGTPPEPEGEITMMGEVTGPLLLQNANGNGTIRANHIFNATGSIDVEFCLTDRIDDSSGNKLPTAQSLVFCSPLTVDIQDLVDVSLENSGPEFLVRGQSSNYVITVTNQQPDAGVGLTATGLELEAVIDSELITAAPAGCTLGNNVVTCALSDLAPGASVDVTIPIIVPADADLVAVRSEIDLAMDQIDVKEANKLLITTPIVFDADFIIAGVADGELEDEAHGSPGNGSCESINGVCTLRSAVMEANALAGPQTIALGNKVYAFTQDAAVSPDSGYGDLDVEEDLTIIGNGPDRTFINASNISRHFDIFNSATLTLEGLTLSGGLTNDDDGETDGGSIQVNNGRLILRNVRITGNTATGNGGAIHDRSFDAEAMLIENTEITANSAEHGAGIASQGGGLLRNVTLSANRASGDGGAINMLAGSLTLTHVTMAGNSADRGGGLVTNGGNATFGNTLIAKNIANTGPNCATFSGTINSSNGNVIETLSGCAFNTQSRDRTGVAAGLTELLDNGGSTRTYALSAGSPAIDNAINGNCPDQDQRGQPRPLDGVGNGQAQCDTGAFEAAARPRQELMFSDGFEG